MNFSLIIPHKNIPDLLQRLLDSIPHRTDMEIIIVDDNSDPQIVDFNNFPGKDRQDVKIIFDKEGKGAGAARNIGIDNSTGKWLLFADSDDIYTSSLDEFLDENITCENDVIYFKCEVINSKEKPYTISYMNLFIDNYIKGKGSVDDVKYGAWEPWNKLVKYSLVRDNNIRFDEITTSNDKMFSLRLGYYAKSIKVTDKIIYKYILRSGSIVHSKNRLRFINSFNTIIEQNSLYHEVNYKRKVFLPYYFIRNRNFLNKDIIGRYFKYLIRYRANPLEGLFSYLFFYYKTKKEIKSRFNQNQQKK